MKNYVLLVSTLIVGILIGSMASYIFIPNSSVTGNAVNLNSNDFKDLNVEEDKANEILEENENVTLLTEVESNVLIDKLGSCKNECIIGREQCKLLCAPNETDNIVTVSCSLNCDGGARACDRNCTQYYYDQVDKLIVNV